MLNKQQNDGFRVYFTSKEVVDKLYLGVVILDNFVRLPELVKERRTIDGTFYEKEALAFKYALEDILEEGYDSVTLYNQNKLMFDWLMRTQPHENTMRDMIYEQIKELMYEIVEQGTEVNFEVIKGNKNEAKKYLDKYVKDVPVRGNLSDMFKRDKVVEFSRKAR